MFASDFYVACIFHDQHNSQLLMFTVWAQLQQ